MLKSCITLRRLAWSTTFMLFIGALLLTWSVIRQQESTLAIRAVNQGASMPDGFSIWHHLDANGIRFKSITPQNDALLITFDSSAQSAAARSYLIERYRTVSLSLSRMMIIRRCSGYPAYVILHTALVNFQESELDHSLW